jgi:hypothetical protein
MAKLRRSWGVINPMTKVKESKKIYSRRDQKQRLLKEVVQERIGIE